ncbi:MAG: glycosyltransferase [Nitrospina sp.]|jgi:glycosyltransferase involved in cell wall biosynthesis|nr:glycosyltransferase [Nitrospina sp.]MBT6347274.1 glycosyltransferase [Nitrospina sp.]
MSKPTVSVIMPTFNRGYCLAESIHSVLNQSFTDFELIVVDDGSTDDSLQLLSEFTSLKLIHLKENRGVSYARNRGFEIAQGEWIAFLDSDDLWEKDKLARQMSWLTHHPQWHAVHTDEIWIRKGVRVNPMNKHQKYSGDIFRHCLPLCVVSPSTVILRAQLLREVGGFDEDMPVCEDYDLWLRIAKQYPFHFIEEKLVVKRGGHEDQLSRKYWGMDRWRVVALHKLLQENKMNTEQKEWVVAMLIEKCGILINGFSKRGKKQEAGHYRKLVAEYSDPVERSLR